jgi:hypothetical protein
MKALFVTRSQIKIGTGTALLIGLALVASIQRSGLLASAASLTVALGVACWLVRNDAQNRAARRVIIAMVLCHPGAGQPREAAVAPRPRPLNPRLKSP